VSSGSSVAAISGQERHRAAEVLAREGVDVFCFAAAEIEVEPARVVVDVLEEIARVLRVDVADERAAEIEIAAHGCRHVARRREHALRLGVEEALRDDGAPHRRVADAPVRVQRVEHVVVAHARGVAHVDLVRERRHRPREEPLRARSLERGHAPPRERRREPVRDLLLLPRARAEAPVEVPQVVGDLVRDEARNEDLEELQELRLACAAEDRCEHHRLELADGRARVRHGEVDLLVRQAVVRHHAAFAAQPERGIHGDAVARELADDRVEEALAEREQIRERRLRHAARLPPSCVVSCPARGSAPSSYGAPRAFFVRRAQRSGSCQRKCGRWSCSGPVGRSTGAGTTTSQP
jgi:hypothetical protein